MNGFAISDKGMVRKNNQDSYFYKKCDGFFYCIVCDGMGGAAAGHEASSRAVALISKSVESDIKDVCDVKEAISILRRIVRNANAHLNDMAQRNTEYSGMGTTVVLMLYLEGLNKSIFLNVGDSRGYLIRNKEIRQITTDHSLVQEMLIKGQITKEEAFVHPNKNIITKALGPDRDIHPDTYTIDMKEGDIALLCSDGLYNMISELDILDIVYSNRASLIDAATTLVNRANLKGGNDNITVALLSVK